MTNSAKNDTTWPPSDPCCQLQLEGHIAENFSHNNQRRRRHRRRLAVVVPLPPSAALEADLLALRLGVTLQPRVVLFLLLVVLALLLLLLVLLVNDGESVVDGPFERLLVEPHQLGFALAMDRMADRRERVARHERMCDEVRRMYMDVCVDDDCVLCIGWKLEK